MERYHAKTLHFLRGIRPDCNLRLAEVGMLEQRLEDVGDYRPALQSLEALDDFSDFAPSGG